MRSKFIAYTQVKNPIVVYEFRDCSSFFLRIFQVNSPDLLNEKWTIMDVISSNILFQAFYKCLVEKVEI